MALLVRAFWKDLPAEESSARVALACGGAIPKCVPPWEPKLFLNLVHGVALECNTPPIFAGVSHQLQQRLAES